MARVGARPGAQFRASLGVLAIGVTGSVAGCGGIADMTDAGASGTFTVETHALGARTHEVEDEQLLCRAIVNGMGSEGTPRTLLDVVLQRDEESWVRLIASSYGEDGVARASNRAGGCEEAAILCCTREPCLEVTVRDDAVIGQYGHDDCWVDVTYSNGWAVGDFHCTLDPRASTEPGTRVHGSFRCPIEE